MKKSNVNYSFSEPTRQSYVAILMIIWKTYSIIVRQAWPIIFLFLFKKSGDASSTILMATIAFAALGMVYSIINFFRYYFYVDDEELVIESGVFKRTKLNVAFSRIQTINFEQNLVHRLFNVVRLKVDTAGSSKSEFNFQAIGMEKAEVLRDLLIKKKGVQKPNELSADISLELDQEHKTVMSLGLFELLRAGAVENHLKSGGLIMLFLFWIWQSLEEIEMDDVLEETVMNQFSGGLVIMMGIVVIFILISFIVSMVRMVLVNYDLKFLRSDNGFKINAGLLTKRDISALDHKIQVISFADNVLKKFIRIKDLTLKQASSDTITQKKAIRIPGCEQEHIDLVIETLYGKACLDDIKFNRVSKYYFIRKSTYLTLIAAIIIGVLIYFDALLQASGVFVIYAILMISIYLGYKKKRYGFNEDMIVIHGGRYGDKTEILPIYKIQALSKYQTPYQRRKKLASLSIFTASGQVAIPYISEAIAQRIMDIFLYKIEIDKRKWM